MREFPETSFSHVGLDWQEYARFDERNLRAAEVDALIGDATKVRTELGWASTVDGLQLARLLADADVEALGP